MIAPEVESGVIDQLDTAQDFTKKYLDDEDFKTDLMAGIGPLIYTQAKVVWQQHCPIGELLELGESPWLEYKSTLRTRTDTGEVWKVLEGAVLKTVAAFLNSYDGGTLLIGVADDGSVYRTRLGLRQPPQGRQGRRRPIRPPPHADHEELDGRSSHRQRLRRNRKRERRRRGPRPRQTLRPPGRSHHHHRQGRAKRIEGGVLRPDQQCHPRVHQRRRETEVHRSAVVKLIGAEVVARTSA